MRLPSDTIRDDLRLLPLADNGGKTLTYALAHDSPAIDAGSNEGRPNFDQRGPGHPRVIGAAADIGAVESESSALREPIFVDGFGSPSPTP